MTFEKAFEIAKQYDHFAECEIYEDWFCFIPPASFGPKPIAIYKDTGEVQIGFPESLIDVQPLEIIDLDPTAIKFRDINDD